MASAADQMGAGLSLANFSQASELKKRLWFTLGALIIFRMLSYVPLPGIDPTALGLLAKNTSGGVLDFFNSFSGGSLKRMSVTALGVMPYITASIVIQLAAALHPSLAALKKEGVRIVGGLPGTREACWRRLRTTRGCARVQGSLEALYETATRKAERGHPSGLFVPAAFVGVADAEPHRCDPKQGDQYDPSTHLDYRQHAGEHRPCGPSCASRILGVMLESYNAG